MTVTAWDPGVVRRESLEEASRHLAELADEVERDGERVLLTRADHDDVVLMSADELMALEETAELAGDAGARQRIAEAEAAHVAGDFVTGDELRAQFGLPPHGA